VAEGSRIYPSKHRRRRLKALTKGASAPGGLIWGQASNRCRRWPSAGSGAYRIGPRPRHRPFSRFACALCPANGKGACGWARIRDVVGVWTSAMARQRGKAWRCYTRRNATPCSRVELIKPYRTKLHRYFSRETLPPACRASRYGLYTSLALNMSCPAVQAGRTAVRPVECRGYRRRM